MKKQLMGKHRKHFVTLTCLVAGMLVLTTAVYANYDDAGGYTNYKNALKNLAFESDNYTAEANVIFIMDGEEMANSTVVYKCNDGDTSTYTLTKESHDGENSTTEIYAYVDGKNKYTYYPKTNTYYESESDHENNKTLVPLDDATSKKAVRFAELMADTFVGDLKNNVVLVSEEDGVRKYSIKVKKNQIPEIVNAGLGLTFTATNNQMNSSSFVTYENHEKAFAAYYLEETGKEYDKVDYENISEKEIGTINKCYDEFDQKYQDILDDKGNEGIVYVLADGDYEYYNTYEKYMEAEHVNGNMNMKLFGNDPYIDDVTLNVSLDKQGRLIENYLEASLVGTDENGKKHTATMKVNSKLYDYDNTTADKFDPEGKIKE